MIKPKDIRIRGETSKDISDIHALNIAAFETDAEALLVNRLRDKKEFFLSIVAEYRKKLVGHILFTPVDVEHNPQKIKTATMSQSNTFILHDDALLRICLSINLPFINR